MTIGRFYVGAEPTEEVYDEVTAFYEKHAGDTFRCTPDAVMMGKGSFYDSKEVLLAVAWNENDEVVCCFYVSASGEAYFPVFEIPYALQALMLLLPEAQRHCPVQMWCKPSNKFLANWVLSTGWADMDKYEKEGIITWSHQ